MDDQYTLHEGSHIPAFCLPANTGSDLGPSDYVGKTNLALFFVREFN